ncbi:MAG: GNAT family N-acetyltransferase [Candidatus Binataceae bacterium]
MGTSVRSSERPQAPVRTGATMDSEHSQFILRPLEQARALWTATCARSDNVTLYHGVRWVRGLVKTYRMKPWVAALSDDEGLAAACLLAHTRRPFPAGRFIGLPFSDVCPPLARDTQALASLLDALARNPATRNGCELRGVSAPSPWCTVDCFANWALDLTRPLNEIERSFDRDFRRKIRRGGEAGLTIQRGDDTSFVVRFYELQLETRRRLGLPAQPVGLFMALREIFKRNDFEVWLASHDGHDLAGAILLRECGRIYMKWSARRLDAIASANHLLVWNVIQAYAGNATCLDLGRTDVRNNGLSRFKKEAGAVATPVAYSFLPAAPRHVSSEVLIGWRKLIAQVWRHLPLPFARLAGAAFYRYLA